jgi:hypothetical protein
MVPSLCVFVHLISTQQKEAADRAEAKKAENEARLEKAAAQKAETAAKKEADGM